MFWHDDPDALYFGIPTYSLLSRSLSDVLNYLNFSVTEISLIPPSLRVIKRWIENMWVKRPRGRARRGITARRFPLLEVIVIQISVIVTSRQCTQGRFSSQSLPPVFLASGVSWLSDRALTKPLRLLAALQQLQSDRPPVNLMIARLVTKNNNYVSTPNLMQ